MREERKKGNIKAEELVTALNGCAYLRRTQGDSREAELLFREALSLNSQIPDEFRYINATTRSTLASTLADQGRFDEALQTAREAVVEYRQHGENNNPNCGFALTILGGFLTEKGDFTSADANLREAEMIFRKQLSHTSLWLGDNLRNQSVSFYQQGKYAEAINRANEAQSIYRESFGTHYDHYPTALIIQGLSLTKTGQTQEGEKILREAVKIRTESLPKEHFWVALANSALGECLALQKRYAEAEPLILDSYNSLKTNQGDKSLRTQEALRRVVKLYQDWQKPELAAQYSAQLPANPK
jgi:serine/threonine-protein kinase